MMYGYEINIKSIKKLVNKSFLDFDLISFDYKCNIVIEITLVIKKEVNMLRLSKLSEAVLELRKAFCRGYSWSKRDMDNKFKTNCRKDT